MTSHILKQFRELNDQQADFMERLNQYRAETEAQFRNIEERQMVKDRRQENQRITKQIVFHLETQLVLQVLGSVQPLDIDDLYRLVHQNDDSIEDTVRAKWKPIETCLVEHGFTKTTFFDFLMWLKGDKNTILYPIRYVHDEDVDTLEGRIVDYMDGVNEQRLAGVETLQNTRSRVIRRQAVLDENEANKTQVHQMMKIMKVVCGEYPFQSRQ